MPNSESLLRGWYLLNLCVGALPPSEHLFPYLRQFLLRTVALEISHPCHEVAADAQSKFERTRLNGARRCPPIALEIDCLEVCEEGGSAGEKKKLGVERSREA